MSLVLGVVLSASVVFIFAWGFAQHRRPVPARWTRFNALSVGFVLMVTMMLPAAAGYLIAAVADPLAALASLNVFGLAAMAAAVALAVHFTPRWVRAGRSGGAAVVPFPVTPAAGPSGVDRLAA